VVDPDTGEVTMVKKPKKKEEKPLPPPKVYVQEAYKEDDYAQRVPTPDYQ